jgi:predicted DCC family thiol-disulfide oxidoreductase YuxK
MSHPGESKQAIVLFDGVCNYCNRWVNFIIRHDKKDHFRFAPLQSPAAEELLRRHNIPAVDLNTFVLIENDRPYFRTTAGLRILKKLNGLYPLLYALIIVPPFIRNVAYRIISKNRYKWWGKRESCMMPDEQVRRKFL